MSQAKQRGMENSVENANPNTVEAMEYEDTGEVQYVYDNSQMILDSSDDFNNITDLVLEDGTRAMIVNGTLVTADGQTLILQDGSDLSQYYVDDNTDHILLSQEQEEQFLEIMSSQNSQIEDQVVQYVQGSDNIPQIKEENGQQVLYIQEDEQENYELAEVDSEYNGMPVQVIKLENEQVIEGIDGAVDLEQFLSQQGIVQLEGDNHQYAILKDGKFHIQTMNEVTNEEILKGQDGSNLTNDNVILEPPTTLPFMDLSVINGKNMNTGELISLSKHIQKKNEKKYFSNRKEIGRVKYQDQFKINSTSNSSTTDLKQLINRKITIGKTGQGKVLVGKIIDVTKKTDKITHTFGGKSRLDNHITTKKTPKDTFNEGFKEVLRNVISMVGDDEIKTNKSSGKTIQQNGNLCTAISDPKVSSQPRSKLVDQNADKNLSNVTSSNSGLSQATNDVMSSISKPKRPISPTLHKISLPEDQSLLSPMQTLTSEKLSPLKDQKECLEVMSSTNASNTDVSTEQSKIVIHTKVVTKDCFEVIARTMTGLMNMESVVKKLKNKTIIIKIIEKSYDHNIGDYLKNTSYCTGYMVREYKLNEEANNFSVSWRFIPDTNSQDTLLGEDNLETILQDRSSGQNNLKKIANLTIQITINPEGTRTTRVIINPPNMYKCKDCAKCFRTSSAVKVHMNECHSSPSLECTICSIKFNSAEEAKNHFFIHQLDDKKGMYECMECNKRFMSSLLLRKHMDIHFKPVNCRHCNQCFSNMRELKKHLPVHEPVVPQLRLTSDIIRENAEEGVGANTKQHEQKIYCCHICGRQFSRHSNLQRHIEIHQGEGAMYKCAICNCSYHYVSSLTRHVVTCHVDITNKRSQKITKAITKPVDDSITTELQYVQENQIVEMISLEDMSAENLQYVTETIGNVTESLSIEEGVEVLQIPVDEDNIVVEN